MKQLQCQKMVDSLILENMRNPRMAADVIHMSEMDVREELGYAAAKEAVITQHRRVDLPGCPLVIRGRLDVREEKDVFLRSVWSSRAQRPWWRRWTISFAFWLLRKVG
ncbi:hypothetical protein UFOVP134_14 [uncultured Caudovirales phage]|uniref:Uncharacterized protein n=1 Tax=uncultured Caudovirales phage TaxID=2100421 RepID=A0A6J5LG35_9CAUD|nr:hypothetical protein UFOVP134_14 [uncultured Caudovirales phage]